MSSQHKSRQQLAWLRRSQLANVFLAKARIYHPISKHTSRQQHATCLPASAGTASTHSSSIRLETCTEVCSCHASLSPPPTPHTPPTNAGSGIAPPCAFWLPAPSSPAPPPPAASPAPPLPPPVPPPAVAAPSTVALLVPSLAGESSRRASRRAEGARRCGARALLT